jgi:hypothetical protein
MLTGRTLVLPRICLSVHKLAACHKQEAVGEWPEMLPSLDNLFRGLFRH